MNKAMRRKLIVIREKATMKIAIRAWVFNEIVVKKKTLKTCWRETCVIMEHALFGKVLHEQFEQRPGFNYSQAGISVLDDLMLSDFIDPKTPDNIPIKCYLCGDWMFGESWKPHKYECRVYNGGIP